MTTFGMSGWVLIGLFAVLCIGICRMFVGRQVMTLDRFLVADRSLGKWEAAFSIAATWIWAPALFLSAQKAYTQGVAGVFWFTVPNVLCLILFAWFAAAIRNKMPHGFSLSGYMATRFSKRVQTLYMVELSALSLCSFAVQLLAGGKILSFITGISYGPLTVALALMTLSYSLVSGLKASVVTDCAQYLWMLLVLLIIVPWAVARAGGLEVLVRGLGGISGDFRHVFKGDSLNVAFSFGVPVTIGLMAGPFGDQSFWQRAFATRESLVKSAFVRGAMLFVLVPLLMSVLGFLAAGLGHITDDPFRVNLELIMDLLPAWTVLPFVLMLLSGLVSTLDSNLCSIAAIAGHDMAERSGGTSLPHALSLSRWGMVILAIAAVGVANINGLKVLHLFLFYGTLRASVLLPTMISLVCDWVHEGGIFWGILCSMAVGLPLFSYGKYVGSTEVVVAGSLITVLTSGVITLGATRIFSGTGDWEAVFSHKGGGEES